MSSKSIAVNDDKFVYLPYPYPCIWILIMSQPLQLLGQCAPNFNPVLYREWLFLAAVDIYLSYIALTAEPRTEWRKTYPIFSEYAIFYILLSNPRLPATFLILVIPGFKNLLNRRSSASCLILPLPCNALAEVVVPPLPYETKHFLCSWLPLKRDAFSKLPAMSHTLSPWTEIVVRTLLGIRPGYSLGFFCISKGCFFFFYICFYHCASGLLDLIVCSGLDQSLNNWITCQWHLVRSPPFLQILQHIY